MAKPLGRVFMFAYLAIYIKSCYSWSKSMSCYWFCQPSDGK